MGAHLLSLQDMEHTTNTTTKAAGLSDAKACNTECTAYALGICGYIDSTLLQSPPEVFGLKDKTECPRYREIYAERITRRGF